MSFGCCCSLHLPLCSGYRWEISMYMCVEFVELTRYVLLGIGRIASLLKDKGRAINHL